MSSHSRTRRSRDSSRSSDRSPRRRSRSYTDSSDSRSSSYEEGRRHGRYDPKRRAARHARPEERPRIIIRGLSGSVTELMVRNAIQELRCVYHSIKILTSDSGRICVIEFDNYRESDHFLVSSKGIVNLDVPYHIRYISTQEIHTFFDGVDDYSRQPKIEDSSPCNVLILKGLDMYTTEEEVRAAVGNITNKILYDVRLIKDRTSNMSRGFCFVELGSVEDAQVLLYVIKNMDPPFAINGRKILVGYARSNFGFASNSRRNDNTLASNAIAAARSVQAPLPQYLQAKSTSDTQKSHDATPGDPLKYVFDPYTGYYIDPNTGLYHDRHTGTYYNPYTQEYLYLDPASKKLVPFAHNTAAADTAHAKKSERPSNNDKDKVIADASGASKIAKDMERWSKRMNATANARVQAQKQQLKQIHERRRKIVELNDKVQAQEFFNQNSASAVKMTENKDKALLDETLEKDPNISLNKLVCILCQRKFTSKEMLIKHVSSSKLHITNLENASRTVT